MPDRHIVARRLREEAAETAMLRPQPEQLSNGEENLYTERSASYSKGLPHDDKLGLVDPEAYALLRKALASRSPADFERIPMGTKGGRRLTNPQAGLAFDLIGADSHSLALPPAPRIDGSENSGEMGELYWMALLRDVHFNDYAEEPSVAEAADDLSRFTNFRGPKRNGQVMPETIFRGFTKGDLVGPYVSQFLLKKVNYGTLTIEQRQQTVVAKDYLTEYPDWLESQNGARPATNPDVERLPRYIRNLRDLSRYVHLDAVYQPYLNACLILLAMKAAPTPGNPYVGSSTQDGFATFGAPHLQCLIAEVAVRALKAVWYQKWFVHRRQRPEEFGGHIHNHVTGRARYPIDEEILDSRALEQVYDKCSSYLLPQAFPEGSPTHPSYGAGHAAVAGACVTVLKAFFDESSPIGEPEIPNHSGRDLRYYTGPGHDALTVGGELDKLASNISLGRNAAGVHWRSDYTESVKLGEAVAISVLKEQRHLYNEPHYLTLTKFDGHALELSGGR